jgi:hypothetical protein
MKTPGKDVRIKIEYTIKRKDFGQDLHHNHSLRCTLCLGEGSAVGRKLEVSPRQRVGVGLMSKPTG